MKLWSILAALAALFVVTSVTPGKAEQRCNPFGHNDITRVQEFLYETGHLNDVVDGSMGERTARAIASWQEANGYTPTGCLLDEQMKKVRTEVRARFPSGRLWSAVAIAPDGTHTADWQRLTRSGAVLTVKRRCQKRSKYPDKCIVASAGNHIWLAAVLCRKSRQVAVFVGGGDTDETAARNLVADAARDGWSSCTVLIQVNAINGPLGWEEENTFALERWWEKK